MAEGTQGMSDQDPEVLRREIASTRDDMGETLDQIEDRVRPRRIVERRTARMRSTLTRARTAVMGSAESAGQRASGVAGGMGDKAHQAQESLMERAGSAVDTVEHVPEAAMERARGNPLGAGIVAFGLGVVAAGILPDTRSERQVAAAVMPRLEPIKEQIGEAASEVGQQVSESAKEAAQRTGEHAREEAQAATQEVREGEHPDGNRGPGA